MNDFLNKFLKIRSGFFKRMRFVLILDIISLFSIFYAVSIIFNVEFFLERSESDLQIPVKFIPPLLAFILGTFIALSLHRKDRAINVTSLIEEKNPQLREKLRTAYDNRRETNIIVDSLKSEVSKLLAGVSSSRLLSTGKIFSKILVTVLFISGAVVIHQNPGEYNIPPETLIDVSNRVLGTQGNETPGQLGPVGPSENLDQTGKDGRGDIFGKPKIASIEGKDIDLTLYPGMEAGFDVRDASETMDQFIQSAEFPVDVVGSNVSDGGYGTLMKKTEVEKELIDRYAVERSKI